MIDKLTFSRARRAVLGETTVSGGIGTLSEGALHRILKNTLEPNEAFQEVKYLGCVADIKNDSGIIEIQTASFQNLKPKLKKFLLNDKVCVVYPLPHIKYVKWINTETGQCAKRNRSPKKTSLFDTARELYKIRDFLLEENLTLKILYLEVEDYKLLNGYDKTKKRGAEKINRIPLSIIDEIEFCSLNDYFKLLPEGLPSSFTVKELAKIIKRKQAVAYTLIRFLLPILVIVFSVIDFVGVVLSGETEKMEKAKKRFAIRLIVAAAILFVPAIIELLLKLAGVIDSGAGLVEFTCNLFD
jgi:hypothetical protein